MEDEGNEEYDYAKTWIQWFCSLEDHTFFCEVDKEYIQDSFNLYGIKKRFNYYNEALEMIQYGESPDESQLEDERYLDIYQEAMDIYGLIHARFITSTKGLAMMMEKYQLGHFGYCPRVLCERQHVIPIGLSEELRTCRVKVFCPKCQDVYIPKKRCSDVDGCYFGCSFPAILMIHYPDLINIKNVQTYVPRLYGFRVYQRKGSRFKDENEKETIEVSHYDEDFLKKRIAQNTQIKNK